MKKNKFFNHIEKIFSQGKKKINEKTKLDDVGFDSLKLLELLAFNDSKFQGLKISPDKINKCKTFGELIKLYGKKIS
jgi:acyl carrier protein